MKIRVFYAYLSDFSALVACYLHRWRRMILQEKTANLMCTALTLSTVVVLCYTIRYFVSFMLSVCQMRAISC